MGGVNTGVSGAGCVSGGPGSARGTGQQPGPTAALTGGDHLKPGERFDKFARTGPEPPGCGTDLAVHRNGENATGNQTFKDRPVQPRIAELMAEHDIGRWARRQPVIEVDDVKVAPIGHTVPDGQRAGTSDRLR